MSDLPVQPTQEEIEQFPAMEGEPVFAEDNTDHPDIPEVHKADAKPNTEPEVA